MQICWPKYQILRLWFVWNFGRPDLHIRVIRKLRVSLAFGEYCTIFNPFNGNVFVKHQSCLDKCKKCFYRTIQQTVFSRFSLDIIEIELLRYINSGAHNLKSSDFLRYANLMHFWTETKSSAYISYLLQILLQLSLSLSFHLSCIYYFNFKERIKCGKKGSICYPSVQFIFRLTVCKFTRA